LPAYCPSLGLFHNVEAFLGEGTFGFVTKCHNFETDEAVAIKISKSDPSFLQQARREIAILKQLQCLDPDTCNIVRWNGYFFHKDHICLSFELLDQSLFAYMKERNNFGLPVMELRPIIYQINMALGHLKSKGIAHTDLKPDNVMVVDRHQKPLRVKLIDFGLACPASELTPGFIAQSLWYRAPEVMLHIPYNEAIDMWSLGLIAAELATGYPLYPGNIGMNHRWRLKSPGEFRYMGHHHHHHLLVSLIKGLLNLDADQRLTPMDVPQHPFITLNLDIANNPVGTEQELLEVCVHATMWMVLLNKLMQRPVRIIFQVCA
uniref:Protein kinase domain-containing protein n=1 Tax=Scophthalmus maximus TaxID=52904 RepID=A0A8D3C1J4_SCOMX